MLSRPNPDPAATVRRLVTGADLPRGDSRALFAELVAGRLGEAEIAAILLSLKHKGETVEELVGAAEALLAAAVPFESPELEFADCCGTGGDSSGSINVSTATGLVAAACGLSVVKHGNRSVSSQCGSADVLEALGAQLDCTPQQSRAALEHSGFCFLLAPRYHPGLAHAGPVRKMLGVRTIMNLLGPCCNPAHPPIQLLGVADRALLRPIAETLREIGVRSALVVHGSGLDEIAIHGETEAIRLSAGSLQEERIRPEDAGLERSPVTEITGGGPEENATRLRDLLEGRGAAADRNIVAINAGALLHLGSKASSLADGTAMARDAIASGAAARTLFAYVEASRG